MGRRAHRGHRPGVLAHLGRQPGGDAAGPLGRARLGRLPHCGSEWLSRYELAYAVADCFGYDAAHIKAGRTADLRQDAPRPAHSGLVAEKIARDTGVHPLTLREGLLALRGQLAEARR